jgi:hypothetical protein
MKVGDLVRVKKDRPHHGNYRLGVITRIHDYDDHCWVRWKSWMENDKWMCMQDLEVLND